MSHLAYLKHLKTATITKEPISFDPLYYALGGVAFGSLFTYLYMRRNAVYHVPPVMPVNLGAKLLSAEGRPKAAPEPTFKSTMKHDKQRGPFNYSDYFNQLNNREGGYLMNTVSQRPGPYLS